MCFNSRHPRDPRKEISRRLKNRQLRTNTGEDKHKACTKQKALGGVCKGETMKAADLMLLSCWDCPSLQ